MTSKALKRWRISRGLSQRKAAEALGLKVRQYGNLERGASAITRTVELLAKAIQEAT